MHRFLCLLAILALSLAARSAPAMSFDPGMLPADRQWLVHLDVARVLSSTDTYGQCGVVPAQLRYLDHQDREHVLDYQVQGTGCANDN